MQLETIAANSEGAHKHQKDTFQLNAYRILVNICQYAMLACPLFQKSFTGTSAPFTKCGYKGDMSCCLHEATSMSSSGVAARCSMNTCEYSCNLNCTKTVDSKGSGCCFLLHSDMRGCCKQQGTVQIKT